MKMTDMKSKKLAAASKYAGLGAAELMIGFWFGIGVILAIMIVDSLDYCIEELMSDN